MNSTTYKFVLQKSASSDGLHYVALRITKNRKKIEISIGIKCREKDFVNQEFCRTFPNYKLQNEELLRYKSKVINIVDEFENIKYDFTLEELKEKLKESPKYQDSCVIRFINELIEEQIRSGRTGNARAYDETKKALIKYAGNKISFKAISVTFLEKFEVYLREKGNTNGGIAFRMRELRSIFNKAIVRDIISQEIYPFKYYKISKLKPQKNKRALTIEEFKSIKNININEYPHLVDAYKYFMFSFYTRGINFVDMMKLKWSDIQNGRILYIRSKTKGVFNIEIMEEGMNIIEYYKKQNRNTTYVFPILLSDHLSPTQIEDRKKKVLKSYNSKLKQIAILAKIEKRLTSYVARHTFATILKQKGTSVDKISELMGHSDVKITETYLKEFDFETLDNENRKLLEL